MALLIELIEHFPLRRIKELEEQIVILEEAFKQKYPQEYNERMYMFDDLEWDITFTKKVIKEPFVNGNIHSCISGNFKYQLELLEYYHKKCTSRFFKLCSSSLSYVSQRRIRAICRYNNITYLYSICGSKK